MTDPARCVIAFLIIAPHQFWAWRAQTKSASPGLLLFQQAG